jgi:serine/threonine protein kinase
MATIYSNNERYDHQIYNNDQENIKTITTDILSECQDVEIAQVVKEIIGENRFLNSRVDRYKQISLLPFLDQITNPQKFCIAHFIETKKPYLIGKPILPFEDDRIPLPLLITEKYVYIRKIQPIDQGTFKKVDAAMRFPLMINSSKAPRLVAEATSEKQLEQELKERKIHTLFNGCPGIWPIDFYFSSEKAVSSIMKLGDGNFCVLPTLGLSLATKWKIAKDLLLGLDKIHEEGYIHGDLKLNNILYKIVKDALKIGIIDFGFSFKKTESPPSIFKCGFYGSMSETPPGLLAIYYIPFILKKNSLGMTFSDHSTMKKRIGLRLYLE